MSLSAEAQHVINSLESHIRAVHRALAQTLANGAKLPAELLEHLESAWDDVIDSLDAFGAKHNLNPSIGDQLLTSNIERAETADAATRAAATASGGASLDRWFAHPVTRARERYGD